MSKSKINYIVDFLVLVSFAITALSGLAIKFFMPSGVRQGRLQEFLGIQKNAWDFGINPTSPYLLYRDVHRSKLLWLCGHTLVTSLSFNSLFAIGKTHLNLSSLIVFGIFIHIRQNIAIPEKPPYVCGHYRQLLTNSYYMC
jgi:hypothetical protein